MDNKPIVDCMGVVGKASYSSLRPLFVRAGRALYKILKITTDRKGPALGYIGMSPLRWIAREYNKQADYVCHHTLRRKSEWQEFAVKPGDFELRPVDVLAAGPTEDSRILWVGRQLILSRSREVRVGSG